MIFDVLVCDTDYRSCHNRTPEKVLEGREKGKKKKCGNTCHDQRKHFTPLVYSVDGVVAEEAKAAYKRLGHLLSEKWKQAHSACCRHISGRLSIALVCSTSMCLHTSRLCKARPCSADWGDG